MSPGKSKRGCKRDGSGRKKKNPNAPFRKNHNHHHRPHRLSEAQREIRKERYWKSKSSSLQTKLASANEEQQQQQNETSDLREIAGSFLNHEEIDKLVNAKNPEHFDIIKTSNDKNVHRILDSLVKNVVPQKSVRDNIMSAISNCHGGDEQSKQALLNMVWCGSMIRNFSKHKLYFFLYLLDATFIIIAVPPNGCVMGYVDSKRKNKSYQAITLAYKHRMNEYIQVENVWKGKDGKLGKCLLGYKQIGRKDAEGIVECIRALMVELNGYLDVLNEDEHRRALEEAFDAADLDFTAIDERIETQETDAQIVQTNGSIYRILRNFMTKLKQKSECIQDNMSNGAVQVIVARKKVRAPFLELVGLADIISLGPFIARKSTPSSLYIHQKSKTFITLITKEFYFRCAVYVIWLLSELNYCRGERKSHWIQNMIIILLLRQFLKDLVTFDHVVIHFMVHLTKTKLYLGLFDAKYDGRGGVSIVAAKLFSPVVEHKQIELEWMVFSCISSKILFLLSFISGQI